MSRIRNLKLPLSKSPVCHPLRPQLSVGPPNTCVVSLPEIVWILPVSIVQPEPPSQERSTPSWQELAGILLEITTSSILKCSFAWKGFDLERNLNKKEELSKEDGRLIVCFAPQEVLFN